MERSRSDQRRTADTDESQPDLASDPGVRVIDLAIDPRHVTAHWQLCGSIADFISVFVLKGADERQMSTSSTIVNELVENAVKYSSPKADRVHLIAWLAPDTLTVEVRNPATVSQASQLRQVTDALPDTATEVFIEAHAQRDQAGTLSQLGLMTIVHEFGAKVHTVFEPHPHEGITWVVVTVVLPIDNSGSTA